MDVKAFLFSLPEKAKPEVLEGQNTLFHFDIGDAGQFTVRVDDGKLSVAEGFSGEATCKVTTVDTVYEDVELGRTNPQMAVMMGKIKINNIGAMMRFAGLFERIA